MAGLLPPLTSSKTRLTNPGIPLYNEYRGGESDTVREIPPEWRAALNLKVTEQSVPLDEPLFELTDEILASKLEQTFTSEKKLRTTRKPAGVFTLLEKFTNKDKEFGTRTRTFHFQDDYPGVTIPSATKDVSTRNFGNKHFEEIVEEIPGVFNNQLYEEQVNDPVPEKFKALFPVSTEEHTEPDTTATDPTLDAGDLKRSEQQTDLFIVKKSHTFHDLSTLPVALTELRMTPEQQIESIAEVLDTDAHTATPDELTTVYDVQQIAGGMYVTTFGTVPDVFSKQLYQKERQLLWQLPPEFRAALQEETESHEEAGTASDPADLTGDEVMKSEQQVTVYKRKVETKTRDLSVLPLSFTDYEVTPLGQVETIVKTLSNPMSDPGPPTPDALTLRSLVQNQGAGLFLTTIGTVDSVFDHKSVSTETPDLLPDIFKAALPAYVHENIISGTSVTDPPALATGDFFKSETRETEFTVKVVTHGRAGISLPKNVTAFRRIGGEQFGAEVTEMHGYLNDMEPSVETGLDIVSSKVTNLGNGTWFRETEKLDTAVAWPTLEGQNFDKEMQVNVFNEEQTVDPTYTPATTGVGDYFVESLKPIDQYHAKRIKLTKTPSATDLASALVEEVDGPFQFPGLVYAVSGGYYRRQASAQLCQHIIRTWWMSSATKPTRGLPGSGMDVEVQDIIMDDIIISSLNDVTRLEYSGMCLHDAITTFSTFVYPATVPSVTAYIALIGTEIVIGASIEQTDIPNLWKIQTKSVVAR